MSDALHDLSLQAGILVDWTDAAGEQKRVTDDTLRAILGALNFPAGSDSEIRDSLERMGDESHAAPALRVATVEERLALPQAREALLTLENGTVLELTLQADTQGRCAVLPDIPGYHTLHVNGIAQPLAIAPPRCWTVEDAAAGEKLAGLAVQLYSLRASPQDSFGSFAALEKFAGEAAKLGIDALAISPVHALFPERPERSSPYAPSSRLFLNPLFAASTQSAVSDMLIDWSSAAEAAWAQLRARYAAEKATHAAELAHFTEEGGKALRDFARFEALSYVFREQSAGFAHWPEAYRDPHSSEIEAFAHSHADEIAFHIYAQYRAQRAIAGAQTAARHSGMRIGLISDLAVGMDARGADAWSAPAAVLQGLSIGAPPDVFNPQGQDWSLTTYSPLGLKRSGYAAFIGMLRAAMRNAGGIRIDHVMGLRRLWVIPEGALPADGAYLCYPQDDLFHLLALESRRHRAIVIGEDLGTVPADFRGRLERAGIAGMRVLWFERDAMGAFTDPAAWPRHSVAMTTTHDLPTVSGWWSGHDLDWQRRLGGLADEKDSDKADAERNADRKHLWAAFTQKHVAEGAPPPPDRPAAAVDAALRLIGKAGSQLAIVPLEDALALPEQPNIPGTTDEHPNWRRLLPADTVSMPQALAERISLYVDARKT
jgi:4-alpha-glucanotransferase